MIDLSHVLTKGTPVYPGDPAVEILILDSTDRSTAEERHCNSGRIATGLHVGTHMDAPFHFMADGITIDQVALERCVGLCVALRISASTIEPEQLEPAAQALTECRRVILNTGWHKHWGKEDYFTSHPVLTGAAARYLVERGVVLVGVDTPSVDRSPFPAHLVLLGAGVLIVENLTNVDRLPSGPFTFCATPLAIGGRDGSPVRAVAF